MRYIAVCMLLCCLMGVLLGCTGWMNDSYVSVTPHIENFSQAESQDTETANNYNVLLEVLRRMVEECRTKQTIDVSSYANIEEELPLAVEQVQRNDPLGSYALSRVQTEVAEVGVRRLAYINMSYRRSKEQMDRIHLAWGSDSVRAKVHAAMENMDNSIAIRVMGYEKMDIQSVARDYYLSHQASIMQCPQVTASVYPDHGNIRIMEIRFQYGFKTDELLRMRQEVQVMLASASGYVRGQTDETDKAQRLYSFLIPLYNGVASTETPVYSLLCEGKGDSASLATAYQLLCENVGLHCYVVNGTWQGEPHSWNIIRIDGHNYHCDLTADYERGILRFHYDDEMYGYEWDTERYPSCERWNFPTVTETTDAPEPAEETESETEPLSSDSIPTEPEE